MPNSRLLTGHCLCKAVSLSTTISTDHPQIAACHCNICRKWSGAATLFLPCEEDVNFESYENIGVYESSDLAERGFCQKCGTHLFYKFKQTNKYYLPVGLFDEDESWVLSHQVFIEEKPNYYTFANKTKNMTGAELFAMYNPNK